MKKFTKIMAIITAIAVFGVFAFALLGKPLAGGWSASLAIVGAIATSVGIVAVLYQRHRANRPAHDHGHGHH